MNNLFVGITVFVAIVATYVALIGDYQSAAFGFILAAICGLVGIMPKVLPKPKHTKPFVGDIPESAFKDAVKLKRPKKYRHPRR